MKFALQIFSNCVVWLLPIIVRTQKNEALIFNRFKESPIHLPKGMSKEAECGPWAVACPAETAAEHDFVEQYSSTKNALFIREIYSNGGKASEVKKHVCKESPKLSLTFKIKSYSFQFGYEIFYELKEAPFFHLDVYKDYKKPQKIIAASRSYLRRGIFEFVEYYGILRRSLQIGVEETWLNEDRRMGFLWLYLFKINFDLSKNILRMAWYEIQDNNRWTAGVECEPHQNYLGSEIYEDTHIDELYETQAEIFRMLTKPPDSCEQENICVKKWSLVPIDQFVFGFSDTPVCSNMTTIPIWRKKVKNVLIKVDAYLYSLFRVVRIPLHVISGISGTLELPKGKYSYFKKSTPVYLDPARKRIPVPKIIYKIVEYRLNDCKPEEPECWNSVVIVIHNDPNFIRSSKNMICPEITTTWGWDELKADYYNNESDIIYVCENTKTLQKKLSIGSKQSVAGGVKLNNFRYSKGQPSHPIINIKPFVDEKFATFHKQGEKPDFGSDKIIERVHTRGNTEDPEVEDQTSIKDGTQKQDADKVESEKTEENPVVDTET